MFGSNEDATPVKTGAEWHKTEEDSKDAGFPKETEAEVVMDVLYEGSSEASKSGERRLERRERVLREICFVVDERIGIEGKT